MCMGRLRRHGIGEHIQAMKAFVESTGGAPVQVKSHPVRFGSGDWTCVVGELENGTRMVTVAKWRDGAIAEEYIWPASCSPSRCAHHHTQRQLASEAVVSRHEGAPRSRRRGEGEWRIIHRHGDVLTPVEVKW